MDQKDLDEIENWKNQRLNYVETYGINIFKKKEKPQIILKLINLTARITKLILILVIILIIVGTIGGLMAYYHYVNSKIHINPTETIYGMYNKRTKIISKNVDDNDNGEYILTIKKKPEIKFKAIIEWNQMQEDYSDQCQKYYFQKWQNNNKNNIIVEEKSINGLLRYSQFIEINEYEQIENAINIMYEFIKSSEEYFFPDWDIYLKVGKKRIYPFENIKIDKIQAIKKSQQKYMEIKNSKDEVDEEIKQDLIKDFLGITIK